MTGILREDLRTFVTVIRSVLLRTRNFSEKCCRETRNIHLKFSDVFLIHVPFISNEEIYSRARQATDENIIRHMRVAFWIIKATNAHSKYATMVARKCFDVNLNYITCLLPAT